MTEEQEPLKHWAKTAHFPQPLQWGEIESTILAHPPPPPGGEEVEMRSPLIARLLVLPILVVILLLVLATPVISFVLVWQGVNANDGQLSGRSVAEMAAVGALALSGIPVTFWIENRIRIWWYILVAGYAGAFAGATFVVLQTRPEGSDAGWIPFLSLAAAAIGLGAALMMLFASKSVRRLPQVRQRKLTSEQKRYQEMRVGVLNILIKRGLVDKADIDKVNMVEARLGSWHLLDRPSRSAR